MACFFYLISFIFFLLLLYYFSYYPTNKLLMSVKQKNEENNVIKNINNTFPTSLNSIIFSKPESLSLTKIDTYYDSLSGTVTAISNNKKYVFNLYFDEDIRTLLPILLLSK
ncbi:entry-fusion complex component [Sheeppox virus]|uniref:Entry-fusion complex protein OPG086 n=1 Tax=Sheeppox virus TaxID=10266 RepID=A0A5C0PV43_SHEV|nr:entry-fusion complex component [Sheeppox virus]